jgi:periplasmic protein TonB
MLAMQSVSTVSPITPDMPQAASSQPTSLASTLGRYLVLAVAVCTLLGVGAWLLWPAPDPGMPSAPLPQRTSNAANPPDTSAAGSDWLALARTALNERRLLAPAGDNAVEYYLAQLDQDPGHVGARQALLELIPPAADAVISSIAAGTLDEAQRRLDLLKRMGVSDLRLNPIRAQLVEARSLQERAAAAPEVAVVEMAAATTARMAGPSSAPASTIDARETAPPLPEATPPQQTGSASSVAPAQPAPAVSDGEGSPVDAVATPVTLKIEEPRQIVDVQPAYPDNARQRRLEGLVELEFDIGRDGSVSQIEVLRSEPPRIFDREAVRAALRWRFEPRREDGVAVATRGRKTLHFKLKAG